ncbi:MAG: GNAT family N-acetyltransferase [Deltaproteobacteria bacterium]|nr:GNAT family N-acetyltransferase [Deltaproteobacteria bacterium]
MPLTFRPITPADDVHVARIIRTVMPTFGADGPGFAIHDWEVDHMTESYARPRSAYFVVVNDAGQVVGGGGVAPLEGGPSDVCELKKMYFLPEARGHGVGEQLLRKCLDVARGLGFTRCYLETLERMTAARKLYERLGFTPTCSMGATGHTSCDRFYVRSLIEPT